MGSLEAVLDFDIREREIRNLNHSSKSRRRVHGVVTQKYNSPSRPSSTFGLFLCTSLEQGS